MIFIPWFRIGAAVVLALALFIGVQSVRSAYAERAELRDRVNTLNDTLEDTRATARSTEKALTKRMADKVRIATTTQETLRVLPTLVPAGAPDLPAGFRVLHDAAAAGEVPDPARGADAAPAPAGAVADTVTRNYGSCLDTFNRLERLQQWIKDQSLTSPKASAR